MSERDEVLLEVSGLKVHFPITGGLLRRPVGAVRAVDGVSFSVRAGETVGLVGESGCGKTTVGRAVLGLVDRTAGEVRYRGASVNLSERAAALAFRKNVQMVFQDPMTSLDPRMTVLDLVGEGLEALGLVKGPDEKIDRVLALLSEVQLSREHLYRYPHEFSGGQRQRIGIARALAVGPELLICDESVSALDVSIQAQILNLLADLQHSLGMSYLFITHDLSVVRHIAHRILVMYLGQIVEEGTVDEIFERPGHPYTRGLLASVPSRDPSTPRLVARIDGDVPSPANPPSGCRFHTRCPERMERCAVEEPELLTIGRRRVACHLLTDAAAFEAPNRP